jgi:hypothetical protein
VDHLALRNGGNNTQRRLLTPGAARHVQCKDTLRQPCPAPARQGRRTIFYNTFTLSLRSRYDFPRPVGYTFLRVPREGTHHDRADDRTFQGPIASPAHHEDGSSLC